MATKQTTVQDHESDLGAWMIVRREPPPALRPYVTGYSGYLERERSFARHLQPASTRIPLIINLGALYRFSDPDGSEHRIGSFAAGLHDRPTLVGSDGPQHCLQADLTPLGARRIFNLPMHQLTNRVVELDDLFGHEAPLLVEQLYETPTWDARFSLFSRLLATRLIQAPEVPPDIAQAWDRLEQSGGSASIGNLTRELGWSHRHLIAQFREHTGLPPKKLARILRFERAIASLHGRERVCLATVAQSTGYFDQAHLHRDFREFAGRTPADLLQRRLPDLDGLIGD